MYIQQLFTFHVYFLRKEKHAKRIVDIVVEAEKGANETRILAEKTFRIPHEVKSSLSEIGNKFVAVVIHIYIYGCVFIKGVSISR